MVGSKPPMAIELNNVTKMFGSFAALKNVSLCVQSGHVHGFLGPNGAGKTTTIKIIMDFLRPTAGSVKVFGQDTHLKSVDIKKRVGFLSGDLELYDNLNGEQYLRFISSLRGGGRSVLSRQRDLSKQLQPTLNRKIGTLSRGNKQKIALVSALMHDPDLLILDEPTSGLDPLIQQKFYDAVRAHAKRGKTVFMSSHVLSEIQQVCDVVSFMRQGSVVETVAIDSLLSHSQHRVIIVAKKGMKLGLPPPNLQVTNLHTTDHTLNFDVTKVTPALLRWIASQPISDVTITEANLDQVFLGMYKQEEA